MKVKPVLLSVLERTVPSTWLGWGCFWLLQVVAIVLAGAVVGSISYPLFGTLLGMDLSFQEFLINGILDGGFYALIWAPGISLVTTIMAAHWKRQKAQGKSGKLLDSQD